MSHAARRPWSWLIFDVGQKMKTFAFGLPPAGEAAALPIRSEKIPAPLRAAIARDYEAQYPGVYILAAFDPASDVLAVYDRTREAWVRRKEVKEIVLTPTSPAKGPGYIEIGWMKSGDQFPSGTIWTSAYSEPMHAWMREKAKALAALVSCDFRETQLYADC